MFFCFIFGESDSENEVVEELEELEWSDVFLCLGFLFFFLFFLDLLFLDFGGEYDDEDRLELLPLWDMLSC